MEPLCLEPLGALRRGLCGCRGHLSLGFGFRLTGLKLQGATCSNNKLSLSSAISTALPLTQLRWLKQTNAEKKASVVRKRCLSGVSRSDPCSNQGQRRLLFYAWVLLAPGSQVPRAKPFCTCPNLSLAGAPISCPWQSSSFLTFP